MFKATITDAQLFKNTIIALSGLIEEATFTATEAGIGLRAMDPSHIAMVDFELGKALFNTYEIDKPTKFRVSVSALLKLLKRVEAREVLEFGFNSEKKEIFLSLISGKSRKATLKTMDPSSEEIQSPVVRYAVKIKAASNLLSNISDDCQSIADNIDLAVTTTELTVRARGDMATWEISIGVAEGGLLELNVEKPARATYNLSYFGEIMRSGAKASEVCYIEFSNNMPVRVVFDLPQGGKLLYYLAPRIEAE